MKEKVKIGFTSPEVYIPQKVLSNHDLEKMVDTSDEWIRERTGIVERRISDVPLSEMCVESSTRLIDRERVSPRDIQLIMVTTFTPDYPLPAVACIIQNELGANTAPAFDLAAACSGFLYGLAVAREMCRSYSPTLLVSAEKLSAVTDYQDRGTCVLFGDGAGAVLVQRGSSETHEILDVIIRADGSAWRDIYIPGGGSAYPATLRTVDERLHYMKMNGREVFKNAVKRMQEVVEELLKRNGLSPEDVDLFVPHQANARIIGALREKLQIDDERVFMNIHKYGNTSSASIPIALYEAEKEGRLEKGKLVVLSSFGAGYTWGSALVRW